MTSSSETGNPSVRRGARDGREWTLGTPDTVDWIRQQTTCDNAITSAIPPLYERYLTLVGPRGTTDAAYAAHERRLVDVLAAHGPVDWWLGYLDTGADDVIFPAAKRVLLYADWPYVVVQAGPDQALAWRDSLPDLIFPTDCSWLMSTLWDDSWTCVGGPAQLITALAVDETFGARHVSPGEDATPPGHISI